MAKINTISDKKYIYLFVSLCFITHSIFSLSLGNFKGWGGDEWFSYRDFTWMGLPFSILTKFQIKLFGSLTSDNFIYFKAQGLFWLSLLFLIFIGIYFKSKNKSTKSFILYLILFISLNPFSIEVTQFFRYYSLSLVTSFLICFFIVNKKEIFEQNRKTFYALLILSPFIHLSVFLQLSGFILINEFIFLMRKNNWYLNAIVIGILFLAIIKSDVIFVFLYKTYVPLYSDHLSYNNIINRGFGLRTIIKPINAIFVYLFGPEIAPTQDIFLVFVFIITCAVLSFIFIDQCRKDKLRISKLFFSNIIPFLAIFFILEPLSIPGTVQPEPKHGLFLLPFLVYLLFIVNNYRFGKVFNIFLLSSFLYSDYLMLSKDYPNWKNVLNTIKSDKHYIITDTVSDIKLNLSRNDNVIDIKNETKTKKIFEEEDTVSVIMQGWGFYQILTLEQKWNSAKGTNNGFSRLQKIFKQIRDNNYYLIDGYSSFPLHCMIFVKDGSKLQYKSPWVFDIKYRDLKVPLFIEGNKIIGFNKFTKGEDIPIDSLIYYFIQTSNDSDLDNVIRLTMNDGTEVDTSLNIEKDIHRNFFYRSVLKNKEVHSFKKRPLVSSSLRHPGSEFNSKGSLYKFSEYSDYSKMKSISDKANIILAIIDKK